MLAADHLQGYLTGSIDLVVRHGVDRHVVVDYKTNRSPSGRYDHTSLAAMMVHGNYPLQAALYTVVLHRYLAQRLGATYVPDRHLGGSSYWFVRGMQGPSTKAHEGHRDGVFSWRPSTGFITALDALLAGRSR